MAKKNLPLEVLEFFRKQGAKGGKLSAKARIEKLTPEQRSEIARKAVVAREAKREHNACDRMGKEAIQAVTLHLKLVSQLEVARLSYTQHEISKLEALVEAARIAREKAVAEYLVHRKTHREAEIPQAGGITDRRWRSSAISGGVCGCFQL